MTTPAIRAGFIIGNKYKVISDQGHHYLKNGDILTYKRDDNSICPMFTSEREGDIFCNLDRLEPAEENTDFSIDQIGGATTIRVQRELTAEQLQAVVKILKGN